ncbi:MAG TPA: T9SS type A sorting domain-containing protein [Phaeodactylibacter sp.]|nr:T9SS type A sorting domain-containing protein [Phaeodactylibacter sp.]
MTFKYSLSAILFICMYTFGQAQNPEHWQSKVDPALLAKAQTHNTLDFLILMKAQKSMAQMPTFSTKEEKGQYVFEQLQEMATRTQAPIIALLESHQASYHPFYIVNAIYAKGNLELMRLLASHPAVAQLQNNPQSKLDIVDRGAAISGASPRTEAEWGIQMIGADKIWDLGITGEGVVVAGQDTGYEWEHPAIKEKYRGWDGNQVDHNYNWHDAIHEINPLHNDSIISPDLNDCGLDVPYPCDDHNHGTHTMGTMLGNASDYKIGVAPDARWMACRNMERGYGSPVTYIECFEWLLAPTDLNHANPKPALAPHVINNSWSCPEMEGCNESNWQTMRMVVDNLKAAGIVVVVSAGNSGVQGCESVSAPAAMFDNSFTVGASMEADTIAHFSSRGPVEVDGSGRLKPNVIAPGYNVLSSIRNGAYAKFSGTSMSGPHVAGAVALIISAYPELAGEVEAIENILQSTAVPKTNGETCGGLSPDAVPNHIAGYGRIDAYAAVQKALAMKAAATTDKKVEVLAYPNPTSDLLTLELYNFKGKTTIQLFDAAGKLILSDVQEVEKFFSYHMSLNALPAGLYFLRVNKDEKYVWLKVVKSI